jgi:hypothetical protein
MYSRDPGEIAAFVALRTQDRSLWSEILAVLANMEVGADHKAGIAERLALNSSALPEFVVQGLAGFAEELTEQPRSVTPMAIDMRTPFPEALRLVSALRLITSEDLLPKITAMAADPTASVRREACRTIPFAIGGTQSVDWGQVLLIQLTHDADLVVRGDAVRALVETLPLESNLEKYVRQRVLEILESDSIRIPLFALYGFQTLRLNSSAFTVLEDFRGAISDLAENNASSTVRGAAALVLRDLDQSGGRPASI